MRSVKIRPRRRWWQVLCRVVAFSAPVLAAAYATIPWWVPCGLVRSRLESQMSQQMGVPVRIGSLSLSWSRGVEISELVIDSPDGGGPMVTVDRIQAELAPLSLLRGRLPWVEIDRPHVWVRFDSEGNMNILRLAGLDSDIQPDRVSVHRAKVFVYAPGRDSPFLMDVSDAQVTGWRLKRKGRVTMSAVLRQADTEAPISLYLAAGTPDPSVAAQASFKFSNILLDQLGLPDLLALPLKKFSGTCGGSLTLEVNRRGEINRIAAQLAIGKLDVQPKRGPGLPVIEQAGIDLSAAFDPLTGQVSIQSAQVQLPGLSLSGNALLAAGIGQSHWQAFDAFEVKGEVFPDRLAAVLTGKPQLGGDLAVSGPIGVSLSARRNGPLVNLQLAADATGAELTAKARTIKPDALPLKLELRGELDERTWRFSADQGKLVLGDNRFVGWGTFENMRALADRWLGRGEPLTPASVLADLAGFDWQGYWEVREVDSLRGLSPMLAGMLTDVELDPTEQQDTAPLSGRWSVDRRNGPRIALSAHVATDQRVALAKGIVKPAGMPICASVSATVDRSNVGLRDVDADLLVADAWAGISHGYARLEAQRGPDSEPIIAIGGRFDAEKLAAMSELLPSLAGVDGSIHGQYLLQLAGGVRRVHLSADLLQAQLDLGQWLTKPRGQAASLGLNFVNDTAAPPDRRNALTAIGTAAGTKLLARCVFPGSMATVPDAAKLFIKADVSDASLLVAGSPMLERILADAQVQGSARADVHAVWQAGKLELDARGDADELAYVSSDQQHRKRAGVALRARLSGTLTGDNPSASQLEVKSLAIDLGQSRLELSGQAEIDTAGLDAVGPNAPPSLGPFKASVQGWCVLDEPLAELSPQAAQAIGRYGLTGAAETKMSVRGDGKTVRVHANIDATKMTVRRVGPFVKAEDLPARAELELTIPGDLKQVQVNNLRICVDRSGLLAGGKIDLSRWRKGKSLATAVSAAHVAAWTRQAETLTHILPQLAQLDLSGSASVDVEYRNDDAGSIPNAAVCFRDLRGTINGKQMVLDGTVRAENIQPWHQEDLQIGRAVADQFRFAVGENFGYLSGELTDLTKRPAGSLRLVCGYLDVQGLIDWAEALAHQVQPAGAEVASEAPAAEPAAAHAKATRLIEHLRPYLQAADVKAKVTINHLKTYDAAVKQFYEPRCVELSADVLSGVVTIEYAASLLGGMIRHRLKTDFADAAAALDSQKELTKVMAAKSMQPQLKRYFPGNTVYGQFNRQETTSAPLRDVLANLLDPNVPLRPTGTAKTVTVDGLVVGRAAPRFVTFMFPGLNLARYRYRTMTGFATFEPDGTVENEMIFSGQTYDMYIEGATSPENIADYDIGIILLGSVAEAETHRDWRQGRFPILKWRARIVDAKIHDETVSYPWPTETAFAIFLKNNIAYRAWVNAQKAK